MEYDGGLRVSASALIEAQEIRDIISYPRRIPRKRRDEIALISAEELLGEHEIKDHRAFIDDYGILLNLLVSLRSSERWQRLKEIAARNDLMPIVIMRMFLPYVFDVLEGNLDLRTALPEEVDRLFKAQDQLWDEEVDEDEKENVDPSQAIFDEIMRDSLKGKLSEININLQADIKVMELLSMLFPGKGFDYTVRELHREFLGNLEDYADLVKRNEDLQRIVDIIGRMESELGRKREAKSTGHSEFHSLRLSSDIHRMLPSELMNLIDVDLEPVFYAKFTESKLMTYHLRGRDQVSGPPQNRRKGPVIALVDTSGSMFGEPEVIAKAVVLAIVRRMIPENRDVKVILFSTKATEISLTDRKKMGKEFLDFLSYSFGGGTDFNIALREGLRSLREGEWQGADLMFVSDGYSVLNDPAHMDEWSVLKSANDVRVYSIIINNDNAGGLREISDHVYILDEKAIEEKGGEYGRLIGDLI